MTAAYTNFGPWDIYCKVVDNFGDAGICWRLARILQGEHDLAVRLWIDDLSTLQALCPAIQSETDTQHVEGVEICRWGSDARATHDSAVVVEAFGCGLPDTFVEQMAARTNPPLWIVLEYLSAESWVDGHHALASPHPRLPLARYFFFPGFTPTTGGLLREADLIARREAFGAAQRRAFWQRHGFDEGGRSPLTVSLFAYPIAPVEAWLMAVAQGPDAVVVAIPGAPLLPAVQSVCSSVRAGPGSTLRRGALKVRVLPFLPQAEYDELLWACDINLVRGEDSFVRAQWAAQPFVWQPYRQDDGAHHIKLDAFVENYGAGLAPPAVDALRTFWRAWNGVGGDVAASWREWITAMPAFTDHARRWANQMAESGELAAKLVEFARDRVK